MVARTLVDTLNSLLLGSKQDTGKGHLKQVEFAVVFSA